MKLTDSGGGREYAVISESLAHIIVELHGKPLQWVPKNRCRDMERHYIRVQADLTAKLRAAEKQVRTMKRELRKGEG